MTSPARRAARRHEDEIGRVLAIHHDRPGPRTVIGFAAAWVLMSALTFIAPGETALLAIVPTLAFLVILGGILVMLSGERLIVCERGLLIGSVAPFLTQYVLRYDQIAPGTIVPISGGIRRYHRQTGLAPMPSSRIAWWSRRGISLVGPSIGEARGRRRRSAASRDAGFPWLVGTRSPAEQAAAEIARAAGAAGFVDLARATASAPPRVLSGEPRDAPQQLPGVAVVRRG